MQKITLYAHIDQRGNTRICDSLKEAQEDREFTGSPNEIFEMPGHRLETGDVVDVDMWVGGVYDEDGISTGSTLVTMRGAIVVTERGLVKVEFEGGRTQVVDAILEENQGGYPVEAMRPVAAEPHENSEKFAIYQSEAILSVGDTIEDAIAEMGESMHSVVPFNPGFGSGNYDQGAIVDLTGTSYLGGDSEVCSGSSARIRRMGARLAAQVESVGGNVAFEVRNDGVLDIWED